VVGELPTAWQETKVVFIPKAGKATHTTAKDFRPISLTSFLLKSFEIIISLNIRATVDPTQISEAQQAYTKGKSTKSALHLVVKVTSPVLNGVLRDMATPCSNYRLTRASRISARADFSPSPQLEGPNYGT